MTKLVRQQYESYPYPPRDPAEERQRLLTGSPSHLDEVDHYVFGGRRDFSAPFRALIAGGGTGDAAIMLAQHLADRCPQGQVVHLDLSAASQDVARRRAEVRGLTNLSFVHGSLLEVADLAPGPYDYIDCCGVLHHLPSPEAGLAALTAELSPDGGMGLMVYAPIGRAGVYETQAALRLLAPAEDLADPKRIDIARRLLSAAPPTNPLKRNPFVADHRAGDAGIYDLLLHSIDRAYLVPELIEFLAGAGLGVASFIEPARYDPARYVSDPVLAGRMRDLAPEQRWALAELIAGNIKTHVVYAVPAARADTTVAGLEAMARPEALVPVLRDVSGPEVAKDVKPGGVLVADMYGLPFKLAMPRLAPAMLSRIDGQTSLAEIRHDLDVEPDGFARQFAQLYDAFNGVNRMLLRIRD